MSTPALLKRRRFGSREPRPIVAYVTLAVIASFALIPIGWMVLTSFTSSADIFQFPPSILRSYTLDHFLTVLGDPTLTAFVLNGLLVSIATSVFSVTVGFWAGYAFSKFRFGGRTGLMYLLLIAQIVPQVLLLVTLYTAFDRAGLLNTYIALVLSFTTFTLPLSVMMMKNTFDALPDELIEAARIDGASELRVMGSVLLPVMKTAIIAVALFAFIRAWNDLPFALTLVDTEKQTLPAGLSLRFMGEFRTAYGEMMAASIMTSLPVVVIFLALQKHFVNGAVTGAIK
ncbi:carbohydrate ABC transporter permease [Mycobacterium sp. NAZ190054]|uniref:carbohydrate ABC transporter permease n=1 Tax=Mycobacterium sp. NAZ190054 TaxID=1747766 RepID=UPI0009E8DB56|nr:carbohydrate ABC transporter permease [Mycobacterium sp. NAZ190054]